MDKTTTMPAYSKGHIVNQMDNLNKQAYNIIQNKGLEEAAKFMFNPTEDRPLSYSEIRSRFG